MDSDRGCCFFIALPFLLLFVVVLIIGIGDLCLYTGPELLGQAVPSNRVECTIEYDQNSYGRVPIVTIQGNYVTFVVDCGNSGRYPTTVHLKVDFTVDDQHHTTHNAEVVTGNQDNNGCNGPLKVSEVIYRDSNDYAGSASECISWIGPKENVYSNFRLESIDIVSAEVGNFNPIAFFVSLALMALLVAGIVTIIVKRPKPSHIRM